MAAGHAIRVENIRYSYEGGTSVLRDISLDIEQGEFLTLLGPSGSGKTTLLRILAGMHFPQSGQVFFDGRDVTHVQPNERNVGFVFQNYALFPHMNVFDNVAFGLRMRRLARAEVVQRAHEALAMVDLSDLADRRPNELSGGQQQRVSLARAVAIRPDVLLMDEPLGSLDKRLRQRLQEELRALQRAIGITTVYVTHDQDEAFALSHRVAVMNGGVIEQLASPVDVYRTLRAPSWPASSATSTSSAGRTVGRWASGPSSSRSPRGLERRRGSKGGSRAWCSTVGASAPRCGCPRVHWCMPTSLRDRSSRSSSSRATRFASRGPRARQLLCPIEIPPASQETMCRTRSTRSSP
jgi:ABC-type sulfate/molybdate transport systems ATPase subunit